MELLDIRKEIDAVDDGLLALFLKRMELSELAAEYKSARGLPVQNREREEAILAEVSKKAGSMEKYARSLYMTLFELSRERQRELLDARNIVLIGMPGCGKSTVARAVGALTGRAVADIDEDIAQSGGRSIMEIFMTDGEAAFRRLEREAIARCGAEKGLVIAVGGGAVLDDGNYPPLHQNGRIYHLERDTALLDRRGRPLSLGADLNAMYEKRLPLYRRFADAVVYNSSTPEKAASEIWADFCGVGHHGVSEKSGCGDTALS